MTVVNVTAALTALGGSEPVTSGRITVEYLRGSGGEPATRAVGAAVTLPAPIVIAIVNGSPVEPVDVPPTDGTCYARVWVECRVPRDAGFLELPAVAIPATGPVDITALVAVDPASFEPVTTVVAAWQLAVDQVAAVQSDVTAKSAQAVEAATDAGTYAGAADFDANRAGQSAFAAGQSAASALGHKNDASTSAGAAAGSATEAQTARTGAETARTGAETAATAAGTARTGAETAQTGAITARTGAETARTGAETAKTAAETARDVALAGQFAGANLGTADLNTITTAGVYIQPGPAAATLARNYPVESGAGVLEVFVLSSTARIQRYIIHGGVAGDVRGVYLRRCSGTVWEQWRFVAGQRTTKTAGQPGTEIALWSPADAGELQLQPVRVILSAADLNLVQVPGAYAVASADATLARNCPREGLGGVLEVLQEASAMTLTQRFTPRSTPEYGRVFYERQYVGGAWRPWYAYSAQRVDKTAGLAMYTWDDVGGRDQLIYGDTGRRDITALVTWPSGVSLTSGSKVFLQRNLYTVTIWVEEGLEFASAVAASTFITLPSGWQPLSQGDVSPILLRNGLQQVGAVQSLIDGQVRISSSGPTGTGANTRFRQTFQTANAWPTTLPGTAVGAIPNV